MKRGGPILLAIFLIILALLEYYTITSIRFAVKELKPVYRNTILGFYLLLSVSWFVMFFFAEQIRSQEANKTLMNISLAFFMGFLILKIIVSLFLFLDDIIRAGSWALSFFFSANETPEMIKSGMSRSAFLQKLGLVVGGTLFATFVYGLSNRYRYNVKRLQIAFDHLPQSFKGLRIVQISDIHSGSFNNPSAVQEGVDLILAEKADVIFFTGDLVNNRSSEMDEYKKIFEKVKAPLGVFSILGNHDYGDYVKWPTDQDRINNLESLKTIHQEMGWKLLLNEHAFLENKEDKIALIGVQNTSAKGFHSYGNLPQAYAGTENVPFKILLSHDPSHWDSEVRKDFQDIAITFSGHTHGMQFGIDLPWLKWSPVQYVYKQWAGLYQEGKQFLYVNRGFGFLGYPGRVGMLPEITVIELV